MNNTTIPMISQSWEKYGSLKHTHKQEILELLLKYSKYKTALTMSSCNCCQVFEGSYSLPYTEGGL